MGKVLVTLTPAAVSRHDATSALVDDRYKLRILTRCRVAGLGLRPGATLRVSADKLKVVAHLVRVGTARPLDQRTARDAELFLALDAAMPR